MLIVFYTVFTKFTVFDEYVTLDNFTVHAKLMVLIKIHLFH